MPIVLLTWLSFCFCNLSLNLLSSLANLVLWLFELCLTLVPSLYVFLCIWGWYECSWWVGDVLLEWVVEYLVGRVGVGGPVSLLACESMESDIAVEWLVRSSCIGSLWSVGSRHAAHLWLFPCDCWCAPWWSWGSRPCCCWGRILNYSWRVFQSFYSSAFHYLWMALLSFISE